MIVLQTNPAWLQTIINGPGGITAGAILVSSLIAATVAIGTVVVTVLWNRKTVRERETIALLLEQHWDKDYIDARQLFVECRDNSGLISCIKNGDSDAANAVKKILNHYEIMAIGINCGILSSKVYAKYFQTRFVADWRMAEGYVMQVRETNRNNKIYAEFERLAKKWKPTVEKAGK